jgi:MFS family permease
MRNKTLIVLTIWVIVYGAVVAALFNGIKQPLVLFSVVIGVGLVGCGTYISTMKPTSDSYGRTQQYIIATTIQILGALGYILFARFAASSLFQPIAIHFLVSFVVSLGFQSVMLIRELNKN